MWTDECEQAFQTLKGRLISAPVPDFSKPFILACDASRSATGYMLMQRDEQRRERAVAYGGRTLKPNETRWAVSEIEMLAIITAIKEYHCYLGGTKFQINSDHSALAQLRRAKLSSNGRLARWALFMEGYQSSIVLTKSKKVPQKCVNAAS